MSIIIFRVDVIWPKNKNTRFSEKSHQKKQNRYPIFTFEKYTMLKK